MDYKYIITTITEDDRATAVLFDNIMKALDVYAAYVDGIKNWNSIIKCVIFYQYSDEEALFPFVYRKETTADAVILSYSGDSLKINLANNVTDKEGNVNKHYLQDTQLYYNCYAGDTDKMEIFGLKKRKILATIKKEK